MKLRFVITALGILGLLPFLASVYGVVELQSLFGLSPYKVFSTYSAVILTFLAGSLWANVIASRDAFNLAPNLVNKGPSLNWPKENVAIALALMSNIIALLCWVLLMLPVQFYMTLLVVLLFGFIIILCIETGWSLMLNTVYRDGYLVLRSILTVIVCSAHIVMIMLS
ncbi:MAG: hypothetical protein ACI84K_000847 [Pseudohongiellaceae bacterium]|jgi:hypothetical protein